MTLVHSGVSQQIANAAAVWRRLGVQVEAYQGAYNLVNILIL